MKNKTSGFLRNGCRRPGFTLIELLVVIAIIGILAALITNLAGPASAKKTRNRVQVELAELETVIDAYQEKLGSYPPDNGNLVNEGPDRPSAATNQLFYELAGATINAAQDEYLSIKGEKITKSDIQTYFKRDGIANSQAPKQFYAAKENRHKAIAGNVQVLVVPVDFRQGQVNPWHYDASSTNRHNLETYDLWAQFIVGGKTNIIGNWKE